MLITTCPRTFAHVHRYGVAFAPAGEAGMQARVESCLEGALTASAMSRAPPPAFCITLLTGMAVGMHADDVLAGAKAVLGAACGLFGGGTMPPTEDMADAMASRVFASPAGSGAASAHVGQGVVFALCSPSVQAASAFTSGPTPDETRGGVITKVLETAPPFPGAPPRTCIAEIDHRRAIDVYREWLPPPKQAEFDALRRRAQVAAESAADPHASWMFGLEGHTSFIVEHGLGTSTHVAGDDHHAEEDAEAAAGCDSAHYKYFGIDHFGPEGEAVSLPGVTCRVGQRAIHMTSSVEQSQARTSKVAAHLLSTSGFEIQSVRGAFSFCCGINLLVSGPQGTQILSEKLGDVLGWAPILGLIGGPELGRMPHGCSEFGTFMYGCVVWSDNERADEGAAQGHQGLLSGSPSIKKR